MKKVANRLAIDFIYGIYKGHHENWEGQKVELYDDMETVTEFSYLGDTMNSGGGCEVAVTSRTWIGRAKFRECQDLLCGEKFPLKVKGIVYKRIRQEFCHELKEPLVRNMFGVKLMYRESSRDLMQMLDLNEAIDQLAKANGVRWYGHVLRKDKNNFLRRALDFKVNETMKGGRPKKTWLKATVAQSRKVGLNESDANNRSRCRFGVNTLSRMMRCKSGHLRYSETKPEKNKWTTSTTYIYI